MTAGIENTEVPNNFFASVFTGSLSFPSPKSVKLMAYTRGTKSLPYCRKISGSRLSEERE